MHYLDIYTGICIYVGIGMGVAIRTLYERWKEIKYFDQRYILAFVIITLIWPITLLGKEPNIRK